MSDGTNLEIFKWKFTGWKATAIVLAIWMTPFVAGYFIGRHH